MAIGDFTLKIGDGTSETVLSVKSQRFPASGYQRLIAFTTESRRSQSGTLSVFGAAYAPPVIWTINGLRLLKSELQALERIQARSDFKRRTPPGTSWQVILQDEILPWQEPVPRTTTKVGSFEETTPDGFISFYAQFHVLIKNLDWAKGQGVYFEVNFTLESV